MPANVMAVYQVLIPIATFDFIPEGFFNMFFDFDLIELKHHDKNVSDQAVEMGYEYTNSLKNLNSVGVLIFMFHVWIMIMFSCCKPLSYKTKHCKSCYDFFFKLLIFTQIILLMIEGYFEMLIAGYLNYASPLFTSNGEYAGVYMAYYCLFLALFVLPAMLIWMMF
jgi:hypothetical protein